MSNAQAACPICPDGRCPSINTMPTSSKPNAERTALAEHAIPDVLAEQFQIGERYEAAASKLVEWLGRPRYGRHLRPAAEWAVHCLVQQGKLSAHVRFTDGEPAPTERPRRQFVDGRLVRPKPEPAIRIYSEIANPAHFDTFIVRAEEALWSWWRETAVPNKKQKAKPDLPVVDLKMAQVRYQKVCYPVTPEGASLLNYLVDCYPNWFTASSIFNKPSSIKKSLPQKLSDLIETESGKGYRLVLPK